MEKCQTHGSFIGKAGCKKCQSQTVKEPTLADEVEKALKSGNIMNVPSTGQKDKVAVTPATTLKGNVVVIVIQPVFSTTYEKYAVQIIDQVGPEFKSNQSIALSRKPGGVCRYAIGHLHEHNYHVPPYDDKAGMADYINRIKADVEKAVAVAGGKLVWKVMPLQKK